MGIGQIGAWLAAGLIDRRHAYHLVAIEQSGICQRCRIYQPLVAVYRREWICRPCLEEARQKV
jgi:hypothetical protein